MWFNSLMDDCERAVHLSDAYKGIFVPIFLKLAMAVLMGVSIVIGVFSFAVSSSITESISISGMVIISFLLYVVYVLLSSLIEVGGINLFKAAVSGEKPTKAHFFNGIRQYVKEVATGNVLIHFVFLLTIPIWGILFVLYAVFIGIPTGGWGLLLLAVLIDAYFSTWTIAIVEEGVGAIDGLKHSFSLAKQHKLPLMLTIVTASLLTPYLVNLSGPLGMLLAGWFIGGIIRVYFRLVIYLTYTRYTDSAPEAPAL